MKNTIYLRRKNKLLIDAGKSSLNNAYINAFLKNIESLGYTFSGEVIESISKLSVKEVGQLHDQIVTDLKVMVGAHKHYNPMYPNFPKQVVDASMAELYLNATAHYFGDLIGRRILPFYKKQARPQLNDAVGLKVIKSGNIDDFNNIFTNLLSAKTAITETDKQDVAWFVKNYKDSIFTLLPKAIPLKENVALLCSNLVQHIDSPIPVLASLIKTATDVLRLCVALSEGDISLAEVTKFKNFSKKERRLILGLLEHCNNVTEDMLRYKDRWKRLGEKLHPFEYQQKHPKCFTAFNIVRNNKPFETFNSKVEAGLLSHDIGRTSALLKTRPGEYARRLDNLIRLADNKDEVLATFKTIVSEVSNPVLLQLIAHFKNRDKQQEVRTFFPKGNVGRAKVIENKLPAIEAKICENVVSLCENTLIEKYKSLPGLGNVYIDEALKDYTVPFALRSASKALKTISRGSRISIPEGNTLRFFIWWKDGKDRTDLDLSAVGLTEQFAHKTDIAYYNLKDLGGYHSGDITSAPNGASEFIDIDIAAFIQTGIRYVVMCVNSFTSQPFYELPECFAGLMIRQFANSGEVYEPKTVENKFDLTANTRICIPLIIDLNERTLLWTDISLTHHPAEYNNVYNNMPAITIIAKSMTSLVKPNLYDLFMLHTKARGNKIDDISQANTIFTTDKGITPFNIDQIIAEFL